MSKEIERRFIPRGAGEVRAKTTENGKRGIEGTAAVFNSLSEEMRMGGREFREEIAPGAFDRALARSDVRGLFNHNPNYVLGRVKAGTMTLTVDASGLRYSIPEMPESRADVLEAIERGDVDGNSFSFIVAQGGDKFSRRDGVVVRTITDFDEILDLGPVTFPAYEETKVSKRCLETVEKVGEIIDNPEHPIHAEIPNFALEHERLLLAEVEQDIAS